MWTLADLNSIQFMWNKFYLRKAGDCRQNLSSEEKKNKKKLWVDLAFPLAFNTAQGTTDTCRTPHWGQRSLTGQEQNPASLIPRTSTSPPPPQAKPFLEFLWHTLIIFSAKQTCDCFLFIWTCSVVCINRNHLELLCKSERCNCFCY